MGGDIVEVIVALAMIASIPAMLVLAFLAWRWMARKGRRRLDESEDSAGTGARPRSNQLRGVQRSESAPFLPRSAGLSSWRPSIRLLIWLMVGAIGGTVLYAGELPGAVLGLALLIIAAVAMRADRQSLAAYLVGLGATGLTVGLTVSPNGAWSVGTTGHSAVCSSAGGCVGTTITHSVVSVPAIGVFAGALLVGAVWLSFVATRSRTSQPANR